MEKKRYKLQINLEDFFNEHNIQYTKKSGELLLIKECLSCGKKNKLYASLIEGVYPCKSVFCKWYEKKNTTVRLVAKVLGIDEKKAFYYCYVNKNNKHSKVEVEKYVEEYIPVTMLKDAVLLTEDNEFMQYLISRGWSKEDVIKNKVRYIKHRDYRTYEEDAIKRGLTKEQAQRNKMHLNRVIIPLFVNGDLKGFQSRDITGKNPIKALNAEGNFRNFYFWNYDNVKNSEEIVIAEGKFDASSFGFDVGIALLGAQMTDEQIKLLLTTKAKRIYFGLDVGTEAIKNKLAEKLFAHYPGDIYDIIFPSVLKSSKDLLNENIIKEINRFCNIEVNEWGKNYIILDHQYKIKIQRQLKESEFAFELDDNDLDSFIEFFEIAGYKDANDYSKEELQKMKEQAKPFAKYELDNEAD